MGMSKTLVLMGSITAVLIIGLSVLMVNVYGEEIPCPDYCENDVWYKNGHLVSEGCSYNEKDCDYGCLGQECADYPLDGMPEDKEEYAQAMWDMTVTIVNEVKAPSADIYGTEYTVGDNVTVFLQLLTDDRLPITDASCYLTMYYPNKTIEVNGTLMNLLAGSAGLYYYDVGEAEILGVHMVSVMCRIPELAWTDDFIDYSKLSTYQNVTVATSNIGLTDSVADVCNGTCTVCSTLNETECPLQFGCSLGAGTTSSAVVGSDGAGSPEASAWILGVNQWTDLAGKVWDIAVLDIHHINQSDDVGYGRGNDMVFRLVNGTLICTNTDATDEVKTVVEIDFDGNGYFDHLIGGSKDDNVYAINDSCDQLWSYTIMDDVLDVEYVDINSTGYFTDTIVGGKDETVYVLNASGDLQWNFTYLGEGDIKTVHRIDENSDGYESGVLAGGKDDDIHILYPNGTEKCEFVTGGDVNDVVNLDWDSDGYKNEFAVASNDDHVYVVNDTCGQLWNFTDGSDMKTVVPADFDDDGILDDLVFGGHADIVYGYHSNGTLVWSYTTIGDIKERAIAVVDFHGNGEMNDVYATGGNDLYAIYANGTLAWSETGFAEKPKVVVGTDRAPFCSGTCTPCSTYSTNETACNLQGGCNFVDGPDYTQGFCQSIELVLNGTSWMTLNADYVNNSGGIDFEIWNSSNDTICTGLGDISTCAGSTSPIYLWANFSRTDPFNTSPLMDRWYLEWVINDTYRDEIRGSGEVHVSNIPFETYLAFSVLPEPLLVSNHDYCIDNDTMGKTLTYEICVDGSCSEISRNETIPCNHGCYENKCNPTPFDVTVWIMLFFLGAIAFIIAIALLYNKYG